MIIKKAPEEKGKRLFLFLRMFSFQCLLFSSVSVFSQSLEDDLILYSKNEINIQDRGLIEEGCIGAGSIIIGTDNSFRGDIYAYDYIVLNKRNEIDGDLYFANSFSGDRSQFNGTIYENQELERPDYTEDFNIDPGYEDINIGDRTEESISPGSYNHIIVGNNSRVILSSGEYHVNSFILKDGAILEGHINRNSITIKIQNNISFGNRCKVTYKYPNRPTKMKFLCNTTSSIEIGNNADINGIIHALNSDINMNSNAKLHGKLRANNINIYNDVNIDLKSSSIDSSRDDEDDPFDIKFVEREMIDLDPVSMDTQTVIEDEDNGAEGYDLSLFI